MANEKVTIDIGLEIRKATAAIEDFSKTANQKLDGINKNVGFLDKAFASFAGNLASNLVSGAISRGFNFLSSSVNTATTDFLDLSKAVAEVNSILPKNTKLTGETTKALIDFSTQFGGTAASQAKAFYQIVSAGITDTTEATALLEVANKAAVAGVTDVTTAINGLTSVLATYSDNGITATQASDALFAAVKEGKTTFGELSNVLGRVTPIADAAGVQFSEIAGTLAFLTKSGQSTEEAATGLKAAIVSIIKPSADSAKVAKSLGIEFGSAALQSKGLSGVLAQVREATNGDTDAITKLFPNISALGAVTAVAKGNFEDFNRILNETKNSSGATAEAFKTIEQSASFQFERLTRTVRNIPLLFSQVAETDFAEVFRQLNDAIVKSIPFLASLARLLVITAGAASQAAQSFFSLTDGSSGLKDELERLERGVEKIQSRLASGGGVAGDEQQLERNKQRIIEIRQELEKRGDSSALKAFDEALISINNSLIKIGKDGAGYADLISKSTIDANREIEKANGLLDEFGGKIANLGGATQKTTIDTSKIDAIVAQKVAELDAELTAEITKQDALNELDKTNKEEVLLAEQEFLQSRLELVQRNSAEESALRLRLQKNYFEQAKNTQKIFDQFEDEQFKSAQKRRQEELRDQEVFLSTAATLSSSSNKTLAAIGKAAAITQIAIKTPPAIASSFEFGTKLGGPPLGFTFAGIAATAMAAQAAQIAGVALASGLTQVPNGFPNDTFPARLTSGERVVNVEQNKDLTSFLKQKDTSKQDETNDLLESQNQVLTALLDAFMSKESTTVVNIGNREIVREVRNGLRAGRSLAV